MAAKKKAAKKKAAKKKVLKKVAKRQPAATATGPASSNGRRYWLVKTEPDVFSFDDLLAAPGRTTFWNGVRNYQARNFMRDAMKRGDGVLVYHSNAEPPGVAGVAEIAREGYPDHTQFDSRDEYFDPDSDPADPRWFMVDVRAVRRLERLVSLPELREAPALAGMVLLQKGSRLSVQPVTPGEWRVILQMGGLE
jgi:predicted RNA-binding protein with PUA-like domain